MSLPSSSADQPHRGMRFGEFVALMAAVMATNALAIDIMLPALPAIGHSLGVTDENHRQWVVSAYLFGFGIAQVFYGTLADRFGRRPVLLFALLAYGLFGAVAAFAGSFTTVLVARAMQGIGAAGTRVLAVSIVRDCYAGAQMARVLSMTLIVFLTIPILAPSLGQLILLVADWPWIFSVLSIFGLAVAGWAWLRLPETLHEEDRLTVSFTRIWAAVRMTLTNRQSMGYTLAMGMVLGGLFGFINSVQQLFADYFHAEHIFPAIFAVVALFMAASSLVNVRIVARIGMRRVSHMAMLGFIASGLVHAALALTSHETIASFTVMQAMTMFCFGLMTSNFGALAMEPMGHIAGTASSLQGAITTVLGALLGFLVGQAFDGTPVPLTLGITLLGVGALVIVTITERGRLFRPPAPVGQPAPAH